MRDNGIIGLTVFITMVFFNHVIADTSEPSGANVAMPENHSLICGNMSTDDGYGPFDYTNYDHYTTKLEVVETHHFTHNVEALIRGVRGGREAIYSELDYTLRHFPNHHRALASLSRFEFVVENPQTQIEQHAPVECYFHKAMNFKPDDGMVRLIYATYLHKKGIKEGEQKFFDKAKNQYSHALRLMPNSAEAHYNLSLFYLDTNNYPLASEHGHKAYNLGFPLPGLKDKLIRKGLWNNTVSSIN